MSQSENEITVKKISNLAYKYEQEFGGCSQAVLGAFKNVLGVISDDVFKSSSGLGGGVGLTGNTCGALLGGVMALSVYSGREYDEFDDKEGKRFKSFSLAKDLVVKFQREYGTVVCKEIQEKIMGRSYNIWIERDEFLAAGGHDDKCPSVCSNAAKWAMEILIANGLV